MARYDEHPPGEIFPGITNPLSTGAPGSEGISASSTQGAVIGSPVIRGTFNSSQVPGDRIDVHAGDTAGGADDLAAHVSPIAPGPQSAYLATGSGTGRTVNGHPNAGV